MSDFFRIHAPPEFAGKTLRQLAVMVHDAEDTDDDVTLLQCQDELHRRGQMAPMSIFMEFYHAVWNERMDAKAREAAKPPP